MEEEKKGKVSILVILLIIALIVIVVMGFFMLKLSKDKTNATEEVAKLNTQVVSLQNTVNNLQGTIDNVADTINSNKSETNDVEVIEGLTSIDISKIDDKIIGLKSKGYKEIEIKNKLKNLGEYHSSDKKEYKYAIHCNEKAVYIKENGEMYLNDKYTGYKYKMSEGDEYNPLIITDDNYLWSLNAGKVLVNSKIKNIFAKEDSLEYVTIIFEDGKILEYSND